MYSALNGNMSLDSSFFVRV